MKTFFPLFLCISFSFLSFSQVLEPSTYSMNPHSDSLSQEESVHLLRRTLFGPTYNQLQQAVNDGLNVTVSNLLTVNPILPPLSYHDNEAVVSVGNTWINSVYPGTNASATNDAREHSLASWLIEHCMSDTNTIAQKMCFFWHNHFGVASSGDARADYMYFNLLRTYTLGNFKDLVNAMTEQPAMLVSLNGENNVASGPNQNYSREHLELFTIGKGEETAPGNYTNYTDYDVDEAAKIFTGFSNVGMLSSTELVPYSIFTPANHNNTTKTLSSALGSATITGNGVNEHIDYTDVVFSQPNFSNYICEKLYRYFVSTNVNDSVRLLVIPEMAQTFVNNNFEILPVLEQLLKSEHFFDVAHRGCLIKSHLEFVMSIYTATNSVVSIDFDTDYEIRYKIYDWLSNIGMDLLKPPSVFGWEPYYIKPELGKLWVIGSSYTERKNFISNYIQSSGFSANSNNFKVDFVSLVNSFSDPFDPNAVIDDLCLVFSATEICQTDKDYLKVQLIDGLPDFEWTDAYTAYSLNPTDPLLIAEINTWMRQAVVAICRFASFRNF